MFYLVQFVKLSFLTSLGYQHVHPLAVAAQPIPTEDQVAPLHSTTVDHLLIYTIENLFSYISTVSFISEKPQELHKLFCFHRSLWVTLPPVCFRI